MEPADAQAKIDGLFAGAMKGRSMYVVPYCMGPVTAPYSRCGFAITHSAYVCLNMRRVTQMGTDALYRMEN